ncbi:MAG: pyruvate kinase [Candidatus Eisenbacteria bacterium]|nr:pyruvate kinase [Candidatus Eisenbacteria bacterium]
MRRRAKIVCTLGPTSRSAAAIRELVEAGMDVARLNFSHGTREEHAEAYRLVREASDASGRAVGILADLQGPKIRIGTFNGGRATLERGAEFTIETTPCVGDARHASTPYENLPRDVKRGDEILIDDGNLKLEVLSSGGQQVRTRVIEGGVVSDHKGLNLPGVRVSAPPLTARDIEDLRFALSLRVDMVALSFVREPSDVDPVRQALAAAGASLPVIAKLEKPQAVSRLEEIVEAFDGLMVARGDLGVEIPLEQVPLVQKRAIRLAREHARPVIVATQMLESMIHHSRPTRAEASDVANAVLDGADALMLSGETSVGENAAAAVATMARIIEAAEAGAPHPPPSGLRSADLRSHGTPDAIAHAAVRVVTDVGARALVAFTRSGLSARCVARHRHPIPVLAFTTRPEVRSQLTLTWGVETFVIAPVDHTDAMVKQVERALLELGRVASGDRVVIVAGTPIGAVGSTNTLHVHQIGSLSR